MAKGTAGVESAGGAEKAATAGLEALVPGTYGGAGSRHDRASERLMGRKESDWVRGTDELVTAEGGTCQDAEEGDRVRGALWTLQRGDTSGHRKKGTEWALTLWRPLTEGLVSHRKRPSKGNAQGTTEGGTSKQERGS